MGRRGLRGGEWGEEGEVSGEGEGVEGGGDAGYEGEASGQATQRPEQRQSASGAMRLK